MAAAQPPRQAAYSTASASPSRRWARPLDRDSWFAIASASALGGVVALVLLMLLQGSGIVPAPGTVAASQAADQARTAAAGLISVDRRVTAVEAMTENLPALRADATALVGRLAAVEQAAASKADVQAVRGEIAALRARADQAPPSASAESLAALASRVARLEAALARTASSPAAAATTAAAPDADRVASLTARLDAAEATIARLTPAAPGAVAPTAAPGNASAAAVAALRRALDAGRPYAAELEVVAALMPDPALSGLRPYAISGITTRDALRTEFSKVADAILSATQGSDDSIFGRLVAGARGLVSVRPAGPIAGEDAPAIVSRMEGAVGKGDISAALRERDGLPPPGKQASADWAGRAAARVMADTLFAEPTATGVVNR
jgi:hypothetical protein